MEPQEKRSNDSWRLGGSLAPGPFILRRAQDELTVTKTAQPTHTLRTALPGQSCPVRVTPFSSFDKLRTNGDNLLCRIRTEPSPSTSLSPFMVSLLRSVRATPFSSFDKLRTNGDNFLGESGRTEPSPQSPFVVSLSNHERRSYFMNPNSPVRHLQTPLFPDGFCK